MQINVELPDNTVGFHMANMMGDGVWTISASVASEVFTVENPDYNAGLQELVDKIVAGN